MNIHISIPACVDALRERISKQLPWMPIFFVRNLRQARLTERIKAQCQWHSARSTRCEVL